jgi:AraC-like DNA-binding protein
MHALFRSAHPYRLPKLAALTRALLYDCRAAFDQQDAHVTAQSASSTLVKRFQELVARCFQDHCAVEAYAECLHVSADHLSAVVKERTGRNARDIIADRVVLEAKRLLTHTDLNVSEIADHLQFSEPTHFARFFKRYTQRSPLEFRREINRVAGNRPVLAQVGA